VTQIPGTAAEAGSPRLAGGVPAGEPPPGGGRIRAGMRVALASGWTVLSFLAWALGTFATLLVPRARLRWRQAVVRHWARGLGRIVGMRVVSAGDPPRAPFFLVSNHLSYMDIILLYTRLDGVFIAKRDMRHWPVLGPLAHLMGTIWVNREVRRDAVRVLDEIDEAVARGDGVILFAEGTTSAGDGLLPMKPALFDWAAREQYPVHYATITYRTPPGGWPAYLAVGWWGDMRFGGHVWNLCRMRGFDAMVEFGPSPVVAPTRGELAARVQRAIADRFVPLVTRETLGS
jgi:1-acyl-sn-glycerol-3-phosphate acyltransferase